MSRYVVPFPGPMKASSKPSGRGLQTFQNSTMKSYRPERNPTKKNHLRDIQGRHSTRTFKDVNGRKSRRIDVPLNDTVPTGPMKASPRPERGH